MAALTDALIVDENLLEAMSFFAGVNNSSSIADVAGVTVICCGRNFPLFNIAMLNQSCSFDLKSNIAAATSYYDALRFGFCFWLCHDRLPNHRGLTPDQLFSAAGFFKLTMPPGLLLRGKPPKQQRYAHIRFKPVDDGASRTTFCHLTSMIFEIPFGIAFEVYGGPEGWHNDYVGWIGYHGTEPVTLAISNYQEGVAGFYSVGTLQKYRRRGFGEAAMRWCIERAHTDRGIDTFVLQSTQAGLALYKRLGFQEVTRFTVYKSKDRRIGSSFGRS